MVDQMLSQFTGSVQGQNALAALQQRGFSPDAAMGLLGHAIPAATAAMNNATSGHAEPAMGLFNIFGGHAGREFLTGAVAGLLRGDGIVGSLEDGGVGMISGHVAEVIAQRTGMNPSVAGEVAAVVTPFIVHFAHDKLSGHPSNRLF